MRLPDAASNAAGRAPGPGARRHAPRALVAGELAAAVLLAGCAAPAITTAPADLARFSAWFGGEYNNHEQVWQQRLDLADPKVDPKPAPVAHRHQIVAPFQAPALGAAVFYLQQSPGTERGVTTLQRVLRIRSAEGAGLPGTPAGTLRMEVFALADAPALVDAHRHAGRLEALTPAALRPLPACELQWRWDAGANRYTAHATVSHAGAATASAPPADCGVPAGAGPLVLGEGQWATGDGGRYRKLRYFSGWVWMKNAGPGAAPDDRKASFARNVQLHTEGQRVPVLLDDGRDSGFELELALLTYQNTRHPILKFTLVDKASGRSHAYTWANTEATLVGMNLGWMQAGFTQKAERTAYGW